MKRARPMSRRRSGGGRANVTKRTTRAKRPASGTDRRVCDYPTKVNNRTTVARGGGSRRGRSTLCKYAFPFLPRLSLYISLSYSFHLSYKHIYNVYLKSVGRISLKYPISSLLLPSRFSTSGHWVLNRRIHSLCNNIPHLMYSSALRLGCFLL